MPAPTPLLSNSLPIRAIAFPFLSVPPIALSRARSADVIFFRSVLWAPKFLSHKSSPAARIGYTRCIDVLHRLPTASATPFFSFFFYSASSRLRVRIAVAAALFSMKAKYKRKNIFWPNFSLWGACFILRGIRGSITFVAFIFTWRGGVDQICAV